MIATKSRRGGALMVLGWAHMPRRAEELFTILEETRDDELIVLINVVGGPGGHLAWAEWGRRKYGIPFGIESGRARLSIVPTPELLS